MGLKDTAGLEPGGLRNLSSIDFSAIPDSVLYQYRAEDFANPWPDSVGSADMSVNGMVSATSPSGNAVVSGDGVDDYGTSVGPEQLPQQLPVGVAFTVLVDSTSSNATYFGAENPEGSTFEDNTTFKLQDTGANGTFGLALSDGTGSFVSKETSNGYQDGSVHAFVINIGTSDSDIEFYVDDMSSTASTTINSSGTIDPSSYDNPQDFGFYSRYSDGADRFIGIDVGVFEFNAEPYTQSEREDFVGRRPEV